MIVQFPKISILPPQKGLEFPGGLKGGGGRGGAVRQKKNQKCIKLNWNFQRCGRGSQKKFLLWGRYGYFLELHIFLNIDFIRLMVFLTKGLLSVIYRTHATLSCSQKCCKTK